MKIEIDSIVPDSTYFRMSDVAPSVDGHILIVVNGHGSRRSWGKPSVTSTVIVNTRTFAVVHVGFHHKHRGSQGWFYFENGQRLMWNQLSLYRKHQVLAAVKRAPLWAHCPGKAA